MKGNKKILDALNDILTAELTGINQYFLHAKMCENWGYERLHQKGRAAAVGEMKHADTLVERILFLEGTPNVQKLNKISIGETVPEQLKLDLALEQDAVKRLNKAIALCVEAGDNGSREILESMLRSEEDHLSWLETQLTIIEQIGVEPYLAEHIHGDE